MIKKLFFALTFAILLLFSASSILANSVPELREGSASPTLVPPETPITFSVTYRDADGSAPKFVRVVTPNWAKDMTKVGGDFKTGARYKYQWTPPEGEQGREYHFEASDGT